MRRIFKDLSDRDMDVTPAEFEEMISPLTEQELLSLRALLVNARCTGIRVLAERGWPQTRQKPN
ncbi:MAG: hypothetical protein HY238_24190 [Acidobacteria bacterium]|nr:hypothetical protein [Acidobacteriota bacterium]